MGLNKVVSRLCFITQGGTFDFVTLVLKIGSTIALLAVVSGLPRYIHVYSRQLFPVTVRLICRSLLLLYLQATVASDIIVLYVLQKRYFYRDKKYLNVVDPHTGYDVSTGSNDSDVRKRVSRTYS